jgi:hypothetical protein
MRIQSARPAHQFLALDRDWLMHRPDGSGTPAGVGVRQNNPLESVFRFFFKLETD